MAHQFLYEAPQDEYDSDDSLTEVVALPPPKNVKFAASTAPDFTSASSMLRAAAVETQYDDPVGAPSTVAMQVETYYDVDEDPALYEHGDQRASDQSIVAPKHDQQFPESPIIPDKSVLQPPAVDFASPAPAKGGAKNSHVRAVSYDPSVTSQASTGNTYLFARLASAAASPNMQTSFAGGEVDFSSPYAMTQLRSPSKADFLFSPDKFDDAVAEVALAAHRSDVSDSAAQVQSPNRNPSVVVVKSPAAHGATSLLNVSASSRVPRWSQLMVLSQQSQPVCSVGDDDDDELDEEQPFDDVSDELEDAPSQCVTPQHQSRLNISHELGLSEAELVGPSNPSEISKDNVRVSESPSFDPAPLPDEAVNNAGLQTPELSPSKIMAISNIDPLALAAVQKHSSADSVSPDVATARSNSKLLSSAQLDHSNSEPVNHSDRLLLQPLFLESQDSQYLSHQQSAVQYDPVLIVESTSQQRFDVGNTDKISMMHAKVTAETELSGTPMPLPRPEAAVNVLSALEGESLANDNMDIVQPAVVQRGVTIILDSQSQCPAALNNHAFSQPQEYAPIIPSSSPELVDPIDLPVAPIISATPPASPLESRSPSPAVSPQPTTPLRTKTDFSQKSQSPVSPSVVRRRIARLESSDDQVHYFVESDESHPLFAKKRLSKHSAESSDSTNSTLKAPVSGVNSTANASSNTLAWASNFLEAKFKSPPAATSSGLKNRISMASSISPRVRLSGMTSAVESEMTIGMGKSTSPNAAAPQESSGYRSRRVKAMVSDPAPTASSISPRVRLSGMTSAVESEMTIGMGKSTSPDAAAPQESSGYRSRRVRAVVADPAPTVASRSRLPRQCVATKFEWLGSPKVQNGEKHYVSFQQNGRLFEVGACVRVQNSNPNRDDDWFAVLEDAWEDSKLKKSVQLRWFYSLQQTPNRPAPSTTSSSHPTRELYFSSISDINPISVVLSRVHVVHRADFQRIEDGLVSAASSTVQNLLREGLSADESDDPLFPQHAAFYFCDHLFDPETGTFESLTSAQLPKLLHPIRTFLTPAAAPGSSTTSTTSTTSAPSANVSAAPSKTTRYPAAPTHIVSNIVESEACLTLVQPPPPAALPVSKTGKDSKQSMDSLKSMLRSNSPNLVIDNTKKTVAPAAVSSTHVPPVAATPRPQVPLSVMSPAALLSSPLPQPVVVAEPSTEFLWSQPTFVEPVVKRAAIGLDMDVATSFWAIMERTPSGIRPKVDAPAFAEYLNECIADTSHALSATVSAKLIFGGTPVSARPNSQPDSAMVAAAALMEAAVRSISSTGALKSSKRIRSSKSSSAAYNQSETQLQDMPVAHQRARHPVIESQDFVGPPALMPMQVSGVIPTVEFDDPDVVAEHAPSDEDPNGASKALLRISLTSPPPVAVPKSSGTQLDIVEMMPCLWCASAVLDNNPERQRIAAIAADACNAASNHNTNGDMHVESQSNMWSQLDMPIPMPSLKRKANAIVSSKEREQREASAAAQNLVWRMARHALAPTAVCSVCGACGHRACSNCFKSRAVATLAGQGDARFEDAEPLRCQSCRANHRSAPTTTTSTSVVNQNGSADTAAATAHTESDPPRPSKKAKMIASATAAAFSALANTPTVAPSAAAASSAIQPTTPARSVDAQPLLSLSPEFAAPAVAADRMFAGISFLFTGFRPAPSTSAGSPGLLSGELNAAGDGVAASDTELLRRSTVSSTELSRCVARAGGLVLSELPPMRAIMHGDTSIAAGIAAASIVTSSGLSDHAPLSPAGSASKLARRLADTDLVDDASIDAGAVVVVADKPRTTLKYLFTLARGLPAVTTEWIARCLEQGRLISASSFRHNAGTTALTGKMHAFKSGTAREQLERCGLIPLSPSQRVLNGLTVMVWWTGQVGAGASDLHHEWSALCATAGATVVDPPRDLLANARDSGSETSRQKRHKWTRAQLEVDCVLIIDAKQENRHCLGPHSEYVLSALKPRQQPGAVAQTAVALLDKQWLIDCLVLQRRCAFDESAAYKA